MGFGPQPCCQLAQLSPNATKLRGVGESLLLPICPFVRHALESLRFRGCKILASLLELINFFDPVESDKSFSAFKRVIAMDIPNTILEVEPVSKAFEVLHSRSKREKITWWMIGRAHDMMMNEIVKIIFRDTSQVQVNDFLLLGAYVGVSSWGEKRAAVKQDLGKDPNPDGYCTVPGMPSTSRFATSHEVFPEFLYSPMNTSYKY